MLLPYEELEKGLDDLKTDKLLNAAADLVEDLCKELGIPLVVRGGHVWHDPVNYVCMNVRYCMEARRNITAAEELSRRLRKAFRCRIAGLDASKDVIWLWDIQEN